MKKVRLNIVDDAYEYYTNPSSEGIQLVMSEYDNNFIKKALESGKTIIIKIIEE